MKKTMFLSVFLLQAGLLFAQSGVPEVSIDSLTKYNAQKVMVCSQVFGIKTTEKITFINVGAAYPNAPLTLVIFAADIINFDADLKKLYDNQPVCITGILKEYKGKEEMIITNSGQIVLGKPGKKMEE